MRSCASRGAKSPGSARNRSSCPRSEEDRRRAAIREIVPSACVCSARAGDVGDWRLVKNRSAGIGGRGDGAAIGPGFEIVDGIDDGRRALVGRAGSVGPVLFQCPGGQAEESAVLR